MLTAALALLSLLLLVALGVAVLLWRSASLRIRDLEGLLRDRVADLDALSIAPPAAVAALQPDAPSLLPDEIERWLRARTPTVRPAAPEES